MVREEIHREYLARVKENESLLARLKRRQFRISMLRLAVFAGGTIAAVTAFSLTITAGVAAIILFTASFLLLVKHYNMLSEEIRFTENLVSINKSEINALEGL